MRVTHTLTPHEAWIGKVITENPCVIITALNNVLMHGSLKECKEALPSVRKRHVHANIYQKID